MLPSSDPPPPFLPPLLAPGAAIPSPSPQLDLALPFGLLPAWIQSRFGPLRLLHVHSDQIEAFGFSVLVLCSLLFSQALVPLSYPAASRHPISFFPSSFLVDSLFGDRGIRDLLLLVPISVSLAAQS